MPENPRRFDRICGENPADLSAFSLAEGGMDGSREIMRYHCARSSISIPPELTERSEGKFAVGMRIPPTSPPSLWRKAGWMAAER
jgi:hypothetical protein